MTAFAVILIILLILCLTGALITYKIAFYSPQKGQQNLYSLPADPQYEPFHSRMRVLISAMEALPYEPVRITSRDGLELAGKYYHTRDGAPLAICFHGYRAVAIRDFCAGGPICLNAGMNVLIVDQRAHGESGGHTLTFGVKERFDCSDWVNYALSRFGPNTEILLCGVSMGAATVIMAAGLPLPVNVKGVIADSPYTSPREIIQKVCRDVKLPPKLVYPFISLGALIFGRFRLSRGDAVSAAKKARVPVLIIHGEDDRFVPCEMSRRIFKANPEMIDRHTFPGAGHVLSYFTDEKRYREIMNRFIRRLFAYKY